MNKILILLIITAISVLGASCVFSAGNGAQSVQNSNATNSPTAKPSEEAAKNTNKDNKDTASKKTESSGDKSACLKSKIEGKKIVPEQTFVFDFEPFPKSCFVSFGNLDEMVDETDLPRGSTFHIFRDGKEVYKFPDAFDNIESCWVEAVAFEDLNADGKTEVIVAGKCLGAKDSYPANAVYINEGKSFRTNAEANRLLEELTKISEIKEYVKKNQGKFF